MDCKTIAEDKNKIFYTYFNTLDIILANVLNRFSSYIISTEINSILRYGLYHLSNRK